MPARLTEAAENIAGMARSYHNPESEGSCERR